MYYSLIIVNIIMMLYVRWFSFLDIIVIIPTTLAVSHGLYVPISWEWVLHRSYRIERYHTLSTYYLTTLWAQHCYTWTILILTHVSFIIFKSMYNIYENGRRQCIAPKIDQTYLSTKKSFKITLSLSLSTNNNYNIWLSKTTIKR